MPEMLDEGEGTLRLMKCVLRVIRSCAHLKMLMMMPFNCSYRNKNEISTSRARQLQGHHPSNALFCSAVLSLSRERERERVLLGTIHNGGSRSAPAHGLRITMLQTTFEVHTWWGVCLLLQYLLQSVLLSLRWPGFGSHVIK